MFKMFEFIKSANAYTANQCPSCLGYVRDDEKECSHCGISVNQHKNEPEFTRKIRHALNIRKQA